MKQMDPESLALKLAHYLGPSHDLYTRVESAQLLKKLLTDDDDLCTWHNLSVSNQSSIKCILLDLISLEKEPTFILHELLHTVSKLAASLLPDNKWPELFTFLYQSLTHDSSSNNLKLSAFLIFGKLAEYTGKTVVGYLKYLHSLFFDTLNDDTLDLDVRIAATKAVISFIHCVPSSNEKERFQNLLPGMMRTLTDALSNGEEQAAAAQFILQSFNELAENEPKFLRTQLVIVVGLILDIAEDDSLGEETRHLAVEFLITLVEAKEKTPGMMKKLPLFISRCFTMLLKLLEDVKDDPYWHTAETIHNIGTTSNFDIGTMYLERFSLALRGKSIVHIAKEQLSAYLDAPQWAKRHAALFALAYIAEGCSKLAMIKNLEQLVNMVVNCLQDPHPRVRWAACWAIAELLRSFSPHLQEQHHHQVIPSLAAAMDDFQNPRVQACAATALYVFCGNIKPETVIPYLDGIVNKQLVLLQNGNQMVQQEALDALSSIVKSVKEHFRTYYDTVMPHLKAVLRNEDFKSNLILRGRAIECISHVGLAGGKEKFREDAKQVMEVLILLLGLQEKGDDPSTKYYLLRACTRICECLGQDFLPYMSALMPFFIQCVQLKPAMTQFVESERAAIACITLGNYAGTLKEDFYPWIPQVVSVLVPLLKFYPYNEVRENAITTMYWLLHSGEVAVEKGIAQGGSESYFNELSNYIILALVEALHKEHVTEICALTLGELNNCLQICRPLLNEDHLRTIVDEVKHVITESASRKRKLKERAKSEDFDAEEDELLREEKEQEDNIVYNVGKILRTLIKAFKAAFLPFLGELSSYLLPMWTKEKTTKERHTSILLFDFLVEEGPKAALKYYNVCLPLILDAINDEDPGVRKDALYGLTLWARYGRSSFKPFVGEALSRINVVIMHTNALEPENESAYDNAVSALGKICQFHGESIDVAQVFPAWLNCLSIKADLYEARCVHEQLCSMVERSASELLGSNYQYFSKVFSVFVEVLCSENVLATKETKDRMINVLRHLQQTISPATFESAWSNLLPRQQMELKSILSPEEDARV